MQLKITIELGGEVDRVLLSEALQADVMPGTTPAERVAAVRTIIVNSVETATASGLSSNLAQYIARNVTVQT